MDVSHLARSIVERVDQALDQAEQSGRQPSVLVLGQEDFPAFQAWAREALDEAIETGSTYRGVRIRHNGAIFLSRLELQSKPGAPNALLL
jgi:hypothetical protein